MVELKEGLIGGGLNLYFIYKFLRILTTPWEKSEAFKLGIVDDNGKILKKKRALKTSEEKEAYTMMHRLVWKLKRLMEKVPFGKSRLASYAAALWLIKENKFQGTDEQLQESFLSFLETNWKNDALILKENYEGDMDKKTFSRLKKEFTIIDEMPNRKYKEKINSLLKDYHGKFKWRDEVLYVTKEIEKYVRSIIRKIGAPITHDEIQVSPNPMREGYEEGTDEYKKHTKKMTPGQEEVAIDEEVFYWYIIKGNTQKGKVSHVGTERQLKLKIRKPTFPSNHVLMKSRKDLKIGDKWKGSYMPEEVEEGWKKGKYTIKDNKGKILGTYNSGEKAQKAMDDLMQKGDYDKLEVSIVEEVELDEGELTGEFKELDKLQSEIQKLMNKGKDPRGEPLKSLIKKADALTDKLYRREDVELDELGGYAGSRHKKIERDKYNKGRRGQGIKDDVEVEEGSSDTADMYALMVKGMKAMPGSKKQKDIIKQINVIRKRLGMELMKEELELDEVFNVGKMSDAKLKAFIAGFDSDERMGMAAAMQLKAAKKEARKRGIKEEVEINEVEVDLAYGGFVQGQLKRKGIDARFWKGRLYVSKKEIKKAKEILKRDPNIDKIPSIIGEEVEIDEAKSKLPPHLAKFFDKDGNLKKDAADRVAKGRAKLNWKDVTPKGYGPKEEVEEGIDIEKASMGAVIKDFQNSDAPQFKGKSDKKRREMAIAAKLSKEENEDDDPVGKSKKNSKKDKVNLKPKMDETMKNYKEFMKNVKETRSQTQEKTGDEAEYQEKRKEVLKKFGVESCSQCETEKEKKACYKALDDAHVADHEEQVKKEEVEVSENTKEYKDVVSKILGRRKEVKEAVTTGGIEYGEQDWDVQHRLENSYPNLHANYAEFHEQGLEGPYLWHGETYFFDRKVGGWYSVTEEDFVDDEISKDLSLAYVKDGMYKRQFAS